MSVWTVIMATSPHPPYTTTVAVEADSSADAIRMAKDEVGGDLVKAACQATGEEVTNE